MPYKVVKSGDKWKVKNSNTGKVYGSHGTKKKAEAQQAALYASKNESHYKLAHDVVVNDNKIAKGTLLEINLGPNYRDDCLDVETEKMLIKKYFQPGEKAVIVKIDDNLYQIDDLMVENPGIKAYSDVEGYDAVELSSVGEIKNLWDNEAGFIARRYGIDPKYLALGIELHPAGEQMFYHVYLMEVTHKNWKQGSLHEAIDALIELAVEETEQWLHGTPEGKSIIAKHCAEE